MHKELNVFKMFPELLIAFSDHAMVASCVKGHIRTELEGLYHHRTRFLSELTFKVNGQAPRFVSANAVDTYSTIAYYLAPSPAKAAAGASGDTRDPEGGEIADKGIEIQVNRFVGGGMHQDLVLTNHGMAEATIELAFSFHADFADLDEAHDGKRRQVAPVTRKFEQHDNVTELTLTYEHPRLNHATIVRFPPARWTVSERDGEVVCRVTLKPREPVKACIEFCISFLGEHVEPNYGCDSFRSQDTLWDQAREAYYDDCTRLISANRVLQDAWERSVADLGALAMFEGEGNQVYTPAAGIPMYQALFGRDTLTTAWQAGILSPMMLQGTIETLAKWQGKRTDDRFDEEPGKHLHQHQLGPLSLLGLNPYEHYWGDYAAPGMFLVAIAWHFAMTHDRAFVKRMRDPVLRTLEWMEAYGDRDGDGFYEYDTKAGKWGTKNQGWKDSNQAMLYPDGGYVHNPIATVEIQGYSYAAKQLMGLVFLALGDVALGTDLLAQAQQLKQRFNEAFWLPDQQYYAVALDGDKRPVASITSNPGHCLSCGIVDHDKAPALVKRLMSPELFSGWGIRTLSTEHPAYNPFSYHLGSVWPSENGSIALGLKRYGFDAELHTLAKGLLDATGLFNLRRLPEAIGGHARDKAHPHPGIYPESNAPQSWSSSAIILLVQAILGIVPLAPIRTLMIDPCLPDWLPELTLENLQLGDARVAIRFERDAKGRTHHQVLSKHGKVRVLRQPPPDDLRAGAGDRVWAMFESLLHR